MLRFRRVLSVVAALALLADGVADARTAPQAISINGRSQNIATIRSNGTLMVALEPLAHKIGIPTRRAGLGLELEVDGAWQRVMPDDVTVREDSAPAMRLLFFPVRRNGQLFVSADDIPQLLDVDASHARHDVDFTKSRADSSTSPEFVAKDLATPTPMPSPTSAPPSKVAQTGLIPPQNKHVVGRMNLDYVSQAGSKYYDAMFDGGTPTVHATLFASGTSAASTAINGTVTIGSSARQGVLGGFAEPLYGSIFTGGASNGLEYRAGTDTSYAWGITPVGGRRILAFAHQRRSITSVVALTSEYSGAPQPLLGVQQSVDGAHSTFEKEFWVGEHGIAAGLHYRTTTRFYTEERLGFAGSGLPLVPGDAPTQINVGYDFSSSLGVRAGYQAARGYTSQPFAQLYGRIHSIELGLAHSASQNSFSTNYSGASVQEALDYSRSPGSSFLTTSGAVLFKKGAIETNGYFMPGNSRDAWIDYHLRRDTPTLLIGFESIGGANASRFGPTIGYAAPFGALMTVKLEAHPLLRGQGLRFSVQRALVAANRYAAPSFVTVTTDAIPASPLYVVVDGQRGQQIISASSRIAVPAGTHYISLQSIDARTGSPEARIVDGTPNTVTLPLWPIAEVQGTVKMPKTASTELLGTNRSLSGITVIIQPGDIIAQTDEHGRFDFPAQALSPDSTITVDNSTLPDGLGAPPPQKIANNGTMTILLRPTKKIEKIKF
jgi:hypothetical protein